MANKSNEHEKKFNFVQKLMPILIEANPSVKDCVYSENNYDETVTVTMANGTQYKIDVTGDSLAAIVYDVFNKMRFK